MTKNFLRRFAWPFSRYGSTGGAILARVACDFSFSQADNFNPNVHRHACNLWHVTAVDINNVTFVKRGIAAVSRVVLSALALHLMPVSIAASPETTGASLFHSTLENKTPPPGPVPEGMVWIP